MTQSQLASLIATAVAAALAAQSKPKASGHKAISTYKPANKHQSVKAKADKVLSDGLTERQLKNDVAVAKAFKKAGILVTPRVDALTYNGWLKVGKRVLKRQHGIYVKGVGTLFHSGQVAVEVQPSKAEMVAETAKITAAHASFPA